MARPKLLMLDEPSSAVADQAYMLEGGRIILEGRARDLIVDDHLMRAYMGLTPEGGKP